MNTMKYAFTFVLIGLLIVTFISCGKDIKESAIDSDVRVGVTEINGSIHFNCETERLYGFSNSTIDFSKNYLGSFISVKFNHVNVSSGGLTVMGPAKCDIELKNLDENAYSIMFNLNGRRTSATLFTNPLSLEFLEEGNVKLK